MIEKDIERVFFSEEELQKRICQLGEQITADYEDKNPLIVGVLKGSFVFMADLTRRINTYCEVDFMAVSSYGNGTSTTGAVSIRKDLSYDVEGRHVIIIEDILDSGVTLSYLKSYIENRRPASIKICTLLDKPARRRANITPDYVGFICPDAFIVGYGLDYAERYRNLPYIGVLKPEIYA
ncbi:MAG: hypoxanthine phosphoribosyltransferase [Oscillospiraceae bacterium]|nr:hypoxanthine phosphoribosyltransferase [Oscillospiraceae bacterium]